MPVREADVVVVGASTAGLFVAYLLAQQGLRVRLFDQQQTLGPPQRTLIVTSRISQVLGFPPHEAMVNRIQQVELLSQNRRALVKLGAPDLVLERERLVQLLAAKAQRKGVEIELGHSFLELAKDADGLNVALYDRSGDRVKEVKTRVLIGADGVSSQVARAVGPHGRADRNDGLSRVAILQARVALPQGASEHTVRVWFHKESTRFFYWVIPKSENEGVAGLACQDQERAKANLEQFLDAHGLEALEFQAADVALYHPGLASSVRLESSEVFLVGDAGGQVKPTTVGGVVAGLRGARAVAESISSWPDGGDTKREKGKEFGALGRELDLHFLMRSLLNRFSDADYDHLLHLLGGRTRGVLHRCSRDELDGTFLKLLVAQPRFLLLAARSMMRMGNGRWRR